MRWFLGWLAGVVAVEFFGTLPLRGIGLTFNFSFQTPIRASGFIDRSDNLTYSSA
jgi:hypothetical protein